MLSEYHWDTEDKNNLNLLTEKLFLNWKRLQIELYVNRFSEKCDREDELLKLNLK